MFKFISKSYPFLFLILIISTNIYASESQLYFKDKIEMGKSYFKTGNYEKSYELFKNLFSDNPENQLINFYLGRSAFELKKYEEAVFTFQRLLIKYPDLSRVKLETARSYMALGAFQEAKRLFREVLETDPPEDVKKNIDKLLNIIKSRENKHKFWSSVQIGYGYDDNVNTTPADQFVEIPLLNNLAFKLDEEKTDFFTSSLINLNHSYKFETQHLNSFDTSFTYLKNLYNSEDEQNLDFFSLNSAPVFSITPTFALKAGIIGQSIRIDNSSYMNVLGANTLFKKRFTNNFSLSLDLSYLNKNYSDYPGKDADSFSFNISSTKKISNFYISPFGGYSDESAQSDINSYKRYTGGASLSFVFLKDFFLKTLYRFEKSEYDSENQLFMAKRADNAHYISTDIQWTFFKNRKIASSLGLSYLYLNNNSNIQIYEYDKNKSSFYVKIDF
jgi:tetratricopeptide (TPR) repeat protein